ncbi:MAG TPA: hypothetical protein VIF12_08620, partial [Micavibrio sp.]
MKKYINRTNGCLKKAMKTKQYTATMCFLHGREGAGANKLLETKTDYWIFFISSGLRCIFNGVKLLDGGLLLLPRTKISRAPRLHDLQDAPGLRY